ncbi:Glutathione transport system permease protein gsiD [Dermatophilus congolensis]|uniref:Glutathione transport system permease protein gsiD n=1 Tax=Dermatophilus congolensis TaxID=1863 RepID=A0AA46BMQ5_9MICO|nr:ABC transporter permease [Dermatophilus congolensis]STD07892.1 Glutathione transport system permease protein gsiD [Dermatophilus congolensis]
MNKHRHLPALLIAGAALSSLVILAAACSFIWTPYDPTAMYPTQRLQGITAQHWLGTDKFGRDVFSQILVGARTTLTVGISSVAISALVGVPLGILAAMGPRPISTTLLRAADILLAFPALLLAIMLGAIFGSSTLTAVTAIGLAGIPTFLRITRANALRILTSDYIAAAQLAGRSPWSIAYTHIWPGIRGTIIIQCSVAFAMAILAEAALSFLGLGTPPPQPSWGRMLQEGQEFLYSHAGLALIPGTAIATAVLGFNLLGDGLRDLTDPRLRGRHR